MTLPPSLAINAGPGPVAADLAPTARAWGARADGVTGSQQPLDFGPPADLTRWCDPNVGYGVLVLDSDASPQVKAAGGDTPAPVQELLARRPGTAVLRWPATDRPESRDRFVRRYFADGHHEDAKIGLTPYGNGPNQLPYYVVIVAGPDEIPWSVQYALEVRHAVGRLPLDGDALGNYVHAMLDGWPQADLDLRAPLLWTVSHPGDITSLMRKVIADPLGAALSGPQLPRLEQIGDAAATGAGLLAAITRMRPGLLVTSSHGLAVGDAATLRAGLGLPLDTVDRVVPLDDLAAAVPGGAVWYAQACCSGGGDAASHYTGLVPAGSPVLQVLQGVAALGASVAPAALRLLGRANPVRAVLGHVEPTFDWTLRVPETGQFLGTDVVAALSSNLFSGQPAGHAFAAYRQGVGQLNTDLEGLRDQLADGVMTVRDKLAQLRLAAIDRQSLVLLGDPTVTLPPLAAAP